MSQPLKINIPEMDADIATMQSNGTYWINISDIIHKETLISQLIENERSNAVIKVETNSKNPSSLFLESLFSNAAHFKINLYCNFSRIIPYILNGKELRSKSTISLYLDETITNALTNKEIKNLVSEINLKFNCQNRHLLVITNIPDFSQSETEFVGLHQQLNGIATVQPIKTGLIEYKALFWSSDCAITANNIQQLEWNHTHWQQRLIKQGNTATTDQNLFLIHEAVLRGAPALTEQWSLFPSNEALVETAKDHVAATVVLTINSNIEVATMTEMVFDLRRQCGSRLKIVLQELSPCIRYHDELLLQHCGCNLIVPHTVRLTKLFAMLKSIQGAVYNMRLPEDPHPLIQGMRPLILKGVLSPARFSEAITTLTENQLLPANTKGILVAFSTRQPLKPSHILTLCKIRREGDFICASTQRVWVFLSGCQVEFLNKTVSSLFSLDFQSISTDVRYWMNDADILQQLTTLHAELRLRTVTSTEYSSAPDVSALSHLPAQPTPISLSGIFK